MQGVATVNESPVMQLFRAVQQQLQDIQQQQNEMQATLQNQTQQQQAFQGKMLKRQELEYMQGTGSRAVPRSNGDGKCDWKGIRRACF